MVRNFKFATLLFTSVCVRALQAVPEILTFDWSPEVQQFTVPDHKTGFFLRAWGAGGGSDSRISGGAGGYVSGFVEVPAGSILHLVVGKGGVQGESGEATAIYLNSVEEKNTLLIAAGGEGSKGRKPGRGGGSGIRYPNFSNSEFLLNRFFLKGEDGRQGVATKPGYDCTRTYKKGTGVGGVNSRGGHGLVVMSRGFQDFCFSGADELWTVPGGVTSITAHAWGAGGGGSSGYINAPGSGAGYATRTRTVDPGDKMLIRVGEGGKRGAIAGNTTYGGAGVGRNFGAGWIYEGSGDGGGRSEVRALLVIAAGGGGSGGGDDGSSVIGHPNTGVGGGTSGGDGGDAPGAAGGGGGDGGTQSAGGVSGKYLGDGTSYPGTNGGFLSGGSGHSGNFKPGGGGGAGLYGGGGGGGGQTGVDSCGGQGGGGSSFPSTGSLSGSGQKAGNESDTTKPYMAGRGGEINGNGGDGFINITW